MSVNCARNVRLGRSKRIPLQREGKCREEHRAANDDGQGDDRISELFGHWLLGVGHWLLGIRNSFGNQ